MSNEDVLWEARGSQTPRGVMYSVIPTIRPGSGTWTFSAEFGGSPEFARSLLDAIDRPDRAIAAHVLLVSYLGPPSPSRAWGGNGDQVTTRYDALPVRFNAVSLDAAPDAGGGASRTLGLNVRADAASWRALRDLWHDRLDVPVVTVGYWVALIPTLLLPIAWYGLRGRAARRTAEGLCPACGYDLRATPDRCPECGAVSKELTPRAVVAST
jgi:hypothetical protein